jgi:hypothetical protein
MQTLLEEMQQCKSIKACIELALTDAYGEYEQTSAWLSCIEEMFGRFDRVKLMGEEVALQGFDLEIVEGAISPNGYCIAGVKKA